MATIERNIARSFKMAREDINAVKKQVKELADRQKELARMISDLKRKTKK